MLSLVFVVLEVEVLGEGPVDELGEEDLAAAVLVDRVELCNEQEVKWTGDIRLEMAGFRRSFLVDLNSMDL